MSAPVVRFDMTSWSGVSENATFSWYKEDDSLQAAATGDVTAIFQDAADYAGENAIPLKVTSRGYRVSDGQVPFLCTTAPITFGRSGPISIYMDGVVWLARPGAGRNALIVESSEIPDIRWRGGEMLFRGSAAPVLIQPKTRTSTIDNNLSINTGTIELPSITVQAGHPESGACSCIVGIDPTFGPVTTTKLILGQMEGGGLAANGLLIWTADNEVRDLDIEHNYIDGVTEHCIQEGSAASTTVFNNRFSARLLVPSNPSYAAVLSYGQASRYEMGRIENPALSPCMASGFYFDASSSDIRYSYTRITGNAGPAVNDAGARNVRY